MNSCSILFTIEEQTYNTILCKILDFSNVLIKNIALDYSPFLLSYCTPPNISFESREVSVSDHQREIAVKISVKSIKKEVKDFKSLVHNYLYVRWEAHKYVDINQRELEVSLPSPGQRSYKQNLVPLGPKLCV